jgi:hypothetical protein
MAYNPHALDAAQRVPVMATVTKSGAKEDQQC